MARWINRTVQKGKPGAAVSPLAGTRAGPVRGLRCGRSWRAQCSRMAPRRCRADPSAARRVRGWWGRSWGGGLLLEPGLTHRLCDHLADATVILTGPSHRRVAGAPLAAVARSEE